VVLVTEECVKQQQKKKKESAVFNSRSRLRLWFRSLLCLFGKSVDHHRRNLLLMLLDLRLLMPILLPYPVSVTLPICSTCLCLFHREMHIIICLFIIYYLFIMQFLSSVSLARWYFWVCQASRGLIDLVDENKIGLNIVLWSN